MSARSARTGDSSSSTGPDSRLARVTVKPVRSLPRTDPGESMLGGQRRISNGEESGQSKSSTPSLTESMAALTALAEAIAAKLPCNPNSPKNQRHQRAFQRQIQRHFRQIEAAFPYQAASDIYDRYVERE